VFDWFRRYGAARALQKRIAALAPGERQAILAASPFEAAAFQGEGFHVFRKDLTDLETAYVTSLGEVDSRTAEDWLIARALENGEARLT